MHELAGFAAGLLIAVLTSPVGISGAVFLLPVQLDLLHIPSPQVTPTNLLFNVIAIPGALVRYRRQRATFGPLARQLVAGTLPGVVIGAAARVYLIPDLNTFRFVAGLLLLPLGAFVIARRAIQHSDRVGIATRPNALKAFAFVVGIIGGVYGIGGGSIIGPVLVGSGMSVAVVAPAALATTLLTSIVGAVAFAVLALVNSGTIAPDWTVGIACGLGGLLGGYLGAQLHTKVPDVALRVLLGISAIALGVTYIAQSAR